MEDGGDMFIVDNHIHLGQPGVHVSDYIYKELRKNWTERGFRYHSVEVASEKREVTALVDVMDEAGLDVCCVLAGNWNRVLPPEQRPYNVPNAFVATQVAQSGGRLIGICSVDPIVDPWDAADELERCVRDEDFRGCKLYPTYAHFDPRDKACEPVYEAASALGIPIHFHMGYTPVCGADMKLQQPWLLDEVGRRFPKLKVVVCHMGYPYAEEAMGLVSRHENFHADLSALGFHHPRKVYQLIHDFGCVNSWDRLLYGSENPFMRTFHKTVMSINEVAAEIGMPEIPQDALERILGGNACRLYRIDRAALGR